MKSKLKYHILPLTSLLFLTIIIHHHWFFNFSPIVWGDSYLDFSEKAKEFIQFPQLWGNNVTFGFVNIGLSFWPFVFFAGILTYLGIPPMLGQRIVFLWPIAIFYPVFMYLLAYYLLRSRMGAWLAGIVYLLNVPFIIGRSGILTLSIATAISPIFILFYIVTLTKKKIYYLIVTALIGYIISFFEFRIFYMVAWILAFYTLYHFLIVEKSRNLKLLIKCGLIFSSIIILVFLLNFYFILGLNSIGSLTNNAAFDRPLIGQDSVSLLHSLLLYFRLWTSQSFDKAPPYIITYRFFIIPVAAIFGLYLQRKNKYVLFFALLALAGIFFTKQEAPPFPDVYKWLFVNLPGFNAFRESTKFYFYIALGYSILLGAFAAGIAKLIKAGTLGKKAYLFIIFIAVLFLWNAKPILTGQLGYMFIPRQIPKEYLIFKDYLFKQNKFFRIFWTPHPSHWGAYSNKHPKISNWDIIAYDWKKFGSGGLFDPLSQEFSNQLFDISSIKYVVVPLDDPKNTDDFYNYMGKRENYIDSANQINFLQKVDLATGELLVYENLDYRPHLYLTKEQETYKRYLSYQKVNFTFLNQTEYEISLKNVIRPVYLNFSESYHPDWKLRVGEFNWYKVMTEKNYFLPDKIHLKNDAGLNSFLINPSVICPSTPCNLNLTLYFRPQSYVYLGLLISAITFVTILFALTYSYVKKI